MTWKLKDDISPAFNEPLLKKNFTRAGFRAVRTKAQRNAIAAAYRALDAETSTLVYVYNEKTLYVLINNPSTATTQDTDWEPFTSVADDKIFISDWNAVTNTPTLSDSVASGVRGQYYLVTGAPSGYTVNDANMFQGTNPTVYDGDMVISADTHWVHISNAVTWDSIQKPQSIVDYVNGTVISHEHVAADVTDLQGLLDAKFDTGDVADHTIAYASVPDAKLATKIFLDTHFYTTSDTYSSSEVDQAIQDAIADAGSGVNQFKLLTDTPLNYTGSGGKIVYVTDAEDGLEYRVDDNWKLDGATTLGDPVITLPVGSIATIGNTGVGISIDNEQIAGTKELITHAYSSATNYSSFELLSSTNSSASVKAYASKGLTQVLVHNANGVAIADYLNESASVRSAATITGNISQTGTAGYTVLDVYANITTTGSGVKKLIKGRTSAEKFYVNSDAQLWLENVAGSVDTVTTGGILYFDTNVPKIKTTNGTITLDDQYIPLSGAFDLTGDLIHADSSQNGYVIDFNTDDGIDQARYLLGPIGEFSSFSSSGDTYPVAKILLVGGELSILTQNSTTQAEYTKLKFLGNDGADTVVFTDSRSTKRGFEYAATGYVTQLHSLADKEYTDVHIGGKNVDTTITNPTATENTWSVIWDNALGKYKLADVSVSGFWKISGTTNLDLSAGDLMINAGSSINDLIFYHTHSITSDYNEWMLTSRSDNSSAMSRIGSYDNATDKDALTSWYADGRWITLVSSDTVNQNASITMDLTTGGTGEWIRFFVNHTTDIEMVFSPVNTNKWEFTVGSQTLIFNGDAGLEEAADYSGTYGSLSYITKGYGDATYLPQSYADTHIAGQELDTTVTSPGVGQDGYSLTWNNTTGKYQLSDISGGGGGTPGGASNSMQYKVDASTFGGFGVWNGSKMTVAGDLQISSTTTAKNLYFTSDTNHYLTTETSGVSLVLTGRPVGQTANFHIKVPDYANSNALVNHPFFITADATSWVSGSLTAIGMNLTTGAANDPKYMELYADGTSHFVWRANGRQTIKSISTPPVPSSGYAEFYFDSSDGDKPYVRTASNIYDLTTGTNANPAGSSTELQYRLSASALGATNLYYSSGSSSVGFKESSPQWGWHHKMGGGDALSTAFFVGSSAGTEGVVIYNDTTSKTEPGIIAYIGTAETTDSFRVTSRLLSADDTGTRAVRIETFKAWNGSIDIAISTRPLWAWNNWGSDLFELYPSYAKWNVPVKVKGYTEGSLPSVSTFSQSMLYVTDKSHIVFSNGTTWKAVGIYSNTTGLSGNNVTLNCGNQDQYRTIWTTDAATSTFDVVSFGITAHVTAKKTASGDKTVTIQGTGYKFIDLTTSLTKAVPAVSVNITISGAANIPSEISLYDSGYLDGSDKVIHVIYK